MAVPVQVAFHVAGKTSFCLSEHVLKHIQLVDASARSGKQLCMSSASINFYIYIYSVRDSEIEREREREQPLTAVRRQPHATKRTSNTSALVVVVMQKHPRRIKHMPYDQCSKLQRVA